MSKPVAIGTEPQLFFDESASWENVTRIAVPGTKFPEPVIVPDRPWEDDRIYHYGSVYPRPDGEGFQMWYMSRLTDRFERKPTTLNHTQADLVLYAESADGVHWEKPNLDAHQFDGSPGNNIVFDLHSPSVHFNPHPPQGRLPYLMAGVHGCGLSEPVYWAAESEDGILWQDLPDNPILDGSDTITLAHDASANELLAFHKLYRPTTRHPHVRTVWLATSKDGHDWSKPALVLKPDSENEQWTKNDNERTEFYNMTAFPCGGQWLGFLTVFQARDQQLPPTAKDQSPIDGPIFASLAHSVDGREWRQFPDRSAVIPNGPSSWDAGTILGVGSPITVGDEVWVYYTGINTTHGGPMPPKRSVIGRASWRRDGFVALRAESAEGTVETAILNIPNGQLRLNAEAARGRILVEVVDRDGNALEGFSREDCEPYQSDDVYGQVHWKHQRLIPIDHPVRIRFILQEALLFSYRLGART